jgi:hypothetical protein
MNASSTFFKIFPPPAFMTMPHAGFDVSDDGIRCIRYEGLGRSRRVGLAASQAFPPGLVDGGDIKDAKEFTGQIKEFASRYRLNRVKVSIPEEKTYLFQSEIFGSDQQSMVQNIESKLEENVPLSASDALFYYEIMPQLPGAVPHASVSVVPKSYIEHYIETLRAAELLPVAFEFSPKAIARAIVPRGSQAAKIIVHSMSQKLGIYIVSGGVVCFTSTVGAGSPPDQPPTAEALELLSREVARVSAYWMSRDPDRPITEVAVVGHDAAALEEAYRQGSFKSPLPVELGNVWQNSVDIEHFIPPISRIDSLEYAVASGLAFDLGDRT